MKNRKNLSILTKSLVIVLSLLIIKSTGHSQNLILWNGENTNPANCAVDYGQLDSLNAHSGKWCFKGIPDQWHSPVINLKCQNTWRSDLSRFNEIWFYAKANQAGVSTKVYFSGWPLTSQIVDITPYIQGGGLLTTDYKLIKIPITAFTNGSYNLNSVEYFYLGTDKTPGLNIFIDDLMAVDTKPNSVTGFQFLSNAAVRIDISDSYDTTSVKNVINYGIISIDDPVYSSLVSPSQVGMHYYPTGFNYSNNSANPYLKHELFLSFKDSLIVGKHYQLQINTVMDRAGNNFPAPQNFPFVYLNEDSINGSVKVNQVGYLPKGPKMAYIGNFLGGSNNIIQMMEISPNSYEVKDKITKQTVFTGTPLFRGYDPLSGEKVYECNFAAFETPGNYYLHVPGIGRSYNFNIADNVYDTTYLKVMRELYYQRCGIALESKYAGKWTHGICHQNDGIPGDDWATSVLYNGESLTDKINLTHGWHDAGDYGKYMYWAAWPLFRIFTSYELFHEKFRDNELNIPESGNGVPDILDEAKWEVDWMRNMQAPDGGVYERVTTVDWPYTMPEFDNFETRFIRQKTTYTTGIFAALMAQSYRIFHPYFPQYADECLVKAKKAWDFLSIHTSPLPVGGYQGSGGLKDETDQDERAWGNIELYKATGETKYLDSFNVHWQFYGHISSIYGSGESLASNHQLCASISYATATNVPVNNTLLTKIKSEYIKYFTEPIVIKQTDGSKYRVGTREDVLAWIAWGKFAMSTTYTWDLILAHYFSGNNLTGNTRYLDYGKINLNVQLGANPQNTTYITGIGSKSPRDPLQHPSLHDGIDDPVPGIAVFGPAAHMSAANPFDAAVQSAANLYPNGEYEGNPYPIFRRWNDIHANVMRDEFNVTSQAEIAMAYAYFKSALAPVVRTSLKVVLQGATTSGQSIMRSDLQSLGLLPDSDPYGLNTKPIVTPNSSELKIVDWIKIDLLDKNNKNVISSRAALLLNDGSILDTNYSKFLTFTGVSPDQYYISISHRNHLSIISATSVALSDISSNYDFTTALTQVLDNGAGNSMNQLSNGVWVMWGGNADGNKYVRYSGPNSDENALLNNSLGGVNLNTLLNVYSRSDLNMDGKVDYFGPSNTDEWFLLNDVLRGNKSLVIKGY